MNEPNDAGLENFGHFILPSQYNDLVRRPSRDLDGERRLLWAVLEDAISSYVANSECSTGDQRTAFVEVRDWFFPARRAPEALFDFRTVCDLLGVNSERLLGRLKSLRLADLPRRRHRQGPLRGRRIRNAAA